jgi:hypothetical protein
LDKLSGKELVKRLALDEAAVKQLSEEIEAQVATAKDREPLWESLGTLVTYLGADTGGVVEASAIRAERQSILDGRLLLSKPDPVPPLISRSSDLLRNALNQSYAAYAQQFAQGVQSLQNQADWARLKPADQTAILQSSGLDAAEALPGVGTLQELLQSLAHCTPQRWAERAQAVAGKLQQAAAACSKKLEPTVQPYAAPARMVRSEQELEAWLDEVRQAVKAKLQSGPVQF